MAKTQCLARVREVRHDIPNVISIDFERCAMPPITSVDDHIKIVLPSDGSDLRQPVSDDAAQPLLRTYTRRRWFKDGSWGIDVLEFGPEPGAKPIMGPVPGGPRPSSPETRSLFVDRAVTGRCPAISPTCSPSPTQWPSLRLRTPSPPYRHRLKRPLFASMATIVTRSPSPTASPS